jgi:hypothetical protein
LMVRGGQFASDNSSSATWLSRDDSFYYLPVWLLDPDYLLCG